MSLDPKVSVRFVDRILPDPSPSPDEYFKPPERDRIDFFLIVFRLNGLFDMPSVPESLSVKKEFTRRSPGPP
jgi:hypothetical protein